MREQGDHAAPLEVKSSGQLARVRLGSYEFKKKSVSRFDLRDPYHPAVAEVPCGLARAVSGGEFHLRLVFWLVPGLVANARPDSFEDAFSFSIETLATVGYGEMYPATPYARVVAAVEILCGLSFTAILTGPTFVRFSRPRAKLIFAANPVVAIHDGKPTLMVRICSGTALKFTRLRGAALASRL